MHTYMKGQHSDFNIYLKQRQAGKKEQKKGKRKRKRKKEKGKENF